MGADLDLSTRQLYFQKAEVEGSPLFLPLPELPILSNSTVSKKPYFLNFLQHVQGKGLLSNGHLWNRDSWASQFPRLENESGFPYCGTSQGLWHVTIHVALQEWGYKKHF